MCVCACLSCACCLFLTIRNGNPFTNQKPGNVCIDEGGTVKIVDFGLSSRGKQQYMEYGEQQQAALRWTVVWLPMPLLVWFSICGLCTWAGMLRIRFSHGF